MKKRKRTKTRFFSATSMRPRKRTEAK